MTRSSTKELFTPFKDPEREFRSSRKLLKTLSLDESRSPKFNLISNLKEYSEEEVAETMAETMKRFMSKTQADHGSGLASSDHEDANEHIEKVLEIVDLLHIPNKTQDQVMLRAFPMSFTRDILDSKGTIPSKTTVNAKVAIQEMAEYSQKWYNGTSRIRSTETSNGLAAIQAQLNNLRREIKKVNEKVYSTQVGCEQCKRPHYTKDCPLKEEGASVSVMPLSTYLNLGLGKLAHTTLTVEFGDRTVKYPKGIAENVLVELRRDQVDDLMPIIEEGKVIDEPMIDIIKTRNNESFDEYPSFVTLTERSISIVPTT
nr:hypothetical protein [Tanacetum cinerariifolium]